MESMVTPTIHPEFWQGKKVFLTGHTGFKGSWLSLWLQSMGAKLCGYALAPNTQPNLFTLANIAEHMDNVIADIRDQDQLTQIMADFQPEIIFHLAAQPLVRYSYEHPVETYTTNVLGVVHLFEAARACPTVKTIVNITTDKCYENREWHWGYRENEPLGGHDPYSSSKACAEIVTSAYRRSFFNSANVGLASARAGNVIGGGDWTNDRLIPDLIRAFTAKEKVSIRYPYAIRPWQHVLEPLTGYLLLAEKLHQAPQQFADSWNFGPYDQDAKPVQWIVEKMISLWGAGASWQLDAGTHVHEAHYLKLDCSKAHDLLHWQPRWTLTQTLETIVAWHRAHLIGADMHAFTLRQIQKYTEENLNG
jgi:CDP-glucose 4,6-dehydratase